MEDMTIEHQIERRRKRRRGIVALLAALAALTLGAGSFSLAQFTDQDTSTWSFTAGSIDIDAEATVGAAVSGMMPGDSVTDDLLVSNLGTQSLRYAMTTAATGALGSALQVEVRGVDVDTVGCGSFDGAPIIAAGTTLNGAAFGSNAQGFNAGDRTLAGGASETLCFRATLPLSASTTLQGASSTATFTFDAEQTVNNP
jgi:camelysin-like metallo-endopeptidase